MGSWQQNDCSPRFTRTQVDYCMDKNLFYAIIACWGTLVSLPDEHKQGFHGCGFESSEAMRMSSQASFKTHRKRAMREAQGEWI